MDSYIVIFLILFFLILIPAMKMRKRVRAYVAVKAANRHRAALSEAERQQRYEQVALMKDKKCTISTIGAIHSAVQGVITEVSGKWVSICHGETEEIINIDHIVNIKENKK